jgi:hypothetical protein
VGKVIYSLNFGKIQLFSLLNLAISLSGKTIFCFLIDFQRLSAKKQDFIKKYLVRNVSLINLQIRVLALLP